MCGCWHGDTEIPNVGQLCELTAFLQTDVMVERSTFLINFFCTKETHIPGNIYSLSEKYMIF